MSSSTPSSQYAASARDHVGGPTEAAGSAPARPGSGAVAIRATDLVKTYRTSRGAPPVRALDGLSLDTAPASVLALLGRNGAGKSTTVRILATLSRPDSGSARVDGLDIGVDPAAARRRIGLVSQRPSSDPMGTGRENLLLAGRVHGLSARDARVRARDLLERFGLSDVADRLVRTYSGGTSRRLDVALGLVNRPNVLFLDEPTTGLDPEVRAHMWAEIGRLAAGDGTSVLLTTHYLEEADHLADDVAIIDAGRVVVRGTPDVLKNELEGDALALELTDRAEAADALAVLGAIEGLGEVALEGRTVRARTRAGAQALPPVLGRLERRGLAVLSATVSRPSLDDVYLRYVGRSLEVDDATSGSAQVAA